MRKTDKSAALLKLLQKPAGGSGEQQGLKIIQVKTTDPDPLTFVFEGTPLALDQDIFEIPIDCYPLAAGDRLLVFPMVADGAANRWGAIAKLNRGTATGKMKDASTLRINGINHDYKDDVLILPKEKPAAGEDVMVFPVADGSKIKYRVVK
jgi:hypothetical protein